MKIVFIFLAVVLTLVVAQTQLSHQNENLSEAEVPIEENLLTLIDTVSFNLISHYVIPFISNFIIVPLFFILRLASLLLFTYGMSLYLMKTTFPFVLVYFAVSDMLVRKETAPGEVVQLKITNSVDKTLDFFRLNSVECRVMITCKAGKFIAENYPSLTELVKKSEAQLWITASNPYPSLMVNAIINKDMVCAKMCNATITKISSPTMHPN